MPAFDEAKGAYSDGLVRFVRATYEEYDEAHGAVPPHRALGYGFLMGEPYTIDSKGRTVWYAFFRYRIGGTTDYFCALMTEVQFLDIATGHYHDDKDKKPIVSMSCPCCGAYTRGRQWHNRDTGYGLCVACIPFCMEQAERHGESMGDLYGIRGVHYDVQEEVAAEG